MIKSIILGSALLSLKLFASGLDQSKPEETVQAIFDAASSGDFSNLKNLCHDDIENDGDTRRVCGCEEAEEKMQENFKEYFAKGAVVSSTIDGNKAEVKFTFGKDGKKEETMKLRLKDNKWYLYSF